MLRRAALRAALCGAAQRCGSSSGGAAAAAVGGGTWAAVHRSSITSRSYGTAAAATDETDGVGDSGSGNGSGSAADAAALSADALLAELRADDAAAQMTPSAVAEWLGRFIVGQDDAKRAVAVAFRNRWRRRRVRDPALRADIAPRNMLMIGPTGCGKTEIARRLAQLAGAPFVKVEATRFTETGYHGRETDEIARDLVDAAAALVKQKLRRAASARVAAAVEEVFVRALAERDGVEGGAALEALRARYRAGELEAEVVEVDVDASASSSGGGGGGGGRGGRGMGRGGGPGDDPSGVFLQGGGMTFDLSRLLGGGGGSGGRGRRERRRLTIAEARPLLEAAEVDALLPRELVMREALRAAQEDGIVFIDEIDKVVTPAGTLRHGNARSLDGRGGGAVCTLCCVELEPLLLLT